MAIATQTMTDEQRKSVALEYLKAFDHGGVTSTGGNILDLFADDAQVYFPKWGIAEGKAEIGKHQDGPWRAGVPDWGAGRWCDVFEIRDFLIQRVFIYLDPDYAGQDTGRYPWLNRS